MNLVVERDGVSQVRTLVQANRDFLLITIPALGTLLLLLLCCFLPDLARLIFKRPKRRQKTAKNTDNTNRNSQHPLISKDDDPAANSPTHQGKSCEDQPSRSGVLEMSILYSSSGVDGRPIDESENSTEVRIAVLKKKHAKKFLYSTTNYLINIQR